MSRCSQRLVLVLMIACPLTATAEDLKDPKEILQRATDALGKTRTISYNATFQGTGWVKDLVPHVTGSVVVGPMAEYDVPRFFTKATVKQGESEETMTYTAGCDGNEYFLIDPKTKLGYMDMDPAVMGSNARSVQRLVVGAFGSKEPLKASREAESHTLLDAETVGGVDCYVVSSAVSGREKAIVWALGKKDFLPRRLTRIYAGRAEGDPDGTTEITITDLKANPKLAANQFNMILPAGFTKSEDYAP